MLEKIAAPPPQMVACDYCGSQIDKREIKHHQVLLYIVRDVCPYAWMYSTCIGTFVVIRATHKSNHNTEYVYTQKCAHIHLHVCTLTTHTHTQQAFDCLQSELRIMQCPKGCGQNIEVSHIHTHIRIYVCI